MLRSRVPVQNSRISPILQGLGEVDPLQASDFLEVCAGHLLICTLLEGFLYSKPSNTAVLLQPQVVFFRLTIKTY